jgi:hypothetical protein
MNQENREKMDAIPKNHKRYMNNAQQDQLRTIEAFGWKIFFIRRPMFKDPVVVVTNQEGSSIGVLEDDGRLNLEPNIIIRP